MKKFTFGNVVYLLLFMALGIYGLEFSSFAPTSQIKIVAKYLSYFFAIYFSPILLIFILNNRETIAKTKKWVKSDVKFYCFIIFTYPLLPLILGFIHYSAISKGLTSIYTNITASQQITTVSVTKKRLYGKRDSHEEIYISGFDEGFPVSRSYYNSINEGDQILVGLKSSRFGVKVSFLKASQ